MNNRRLIIAAERTMFRQGLAALIAADGRFEVAGDAADCDELRRLASRESPDLIVLDSDLPPSEGCDVIACLRALCPRAGIIVLGEADRNVASETEADDALRAERARVLSDGAIAYLPARADCGELLRLLCAVAAARDCPEGDGALDGNRVSGGSGRHRVTERERTIVAMIAQGLCNKEIAHRLGISTQTVKNHVSRLLEKLALADRTQLAVYAVEHDFEF